MDLGPTSFGKVRWCRPPEHRLALLLLAYWFRCSPACLCMLKARSPERAKPNSVRDWSQHRDRLQSGLRTWMAGHRGRVASAKNILGRYPRDPFEPLYLFSKHFACCAGFGIAVDPPTFGARSMAHGCNLCVDV